MLIGRGRATDTRSAISSVLAILPRTTTEGKKGRRRMGNKRIAGLAGFLQGGNVGLLPTRQVDRARVSLPEKIAHRRQPGEGQRPFLIVAEQRRF